MTKNRHKDLIQNENGQVLVLLALVIVVLLGFVGLVVDVGYLYVEKQRMQTGVDASALAGSQVINNHFTDVQKVARDIAERNGLKRSNVRVMNPSENVVTVDYEDNFQTVFLPLFGFHSIKLRATATAEVSQQASPFKYVIFSGGKFEEFIISSNNNIVEGIVHVNGDMSISGNNNIINQQIDVVGQFSHNGKNEIGPVYTSANPIEMPVFDIDYYKSKATKSNTFNRSIPCSENKMVINGIVFVHGDVCLDGNKLEGVGTIVATGSITISGNKLEYSSNHDFIGFYAQENITFEGNSSVVDGFFYAPNGTIEYTGNNAAIKGGFIAKKIIFNGNNNQFIFDSRITSLGSEKVIRLVK